MKYLGIDPGETTGLFGLYDRNGSFVHRHVNSLSGLYRVLRAWNPVQVICEDFDRREKPGRIAPIIEGIGVVKLFSEENDVPVEFQSASYGKAFWDNNKLKQVGFYAPKFKHANDAARHVLQYISFKEGNQAWLNMIKVGT